MEVGAVLFVLALLVIVAAYVMRPLASGAPRLERGGPAATLLAERERLLEAIRELDFDHSLGKVNEQDYRPQRTALAAQGARILQRIDELNGGAAAQDTLEPELEAAVAAIRFGNRGMPRFCHQCGSRVWPGDRFCSSCGAAQREPEG
jgi:hypothetical protein